MKKSNHKHDYQSCLIQYPSSFNKKCILIRSYCMICGKIGKNIDKDRTEIIELSEAIPHFDRIHILTEEELIERNQDVSFFKVSSFNQKFIKEKSD